MSKFSLFSLFSLFVLAALEAPAIAQTVVYDNTTTNTFVTSFTGAELGDEVTLAGSERTITLLEIGVTMQGFAGTGDVRARIYANDGSSGQPGSMLWDSGLFTGVAFSGAVELLAFDVPGVVVPDTITWTLQVSNTTPVAVGQPHFHPPTVGTSVEHAWFGGPGSWTMLNPFPPTDLMARITAEGEGSDCPADLNGDGVIDLTDLATLLANFGSAGSAEEGDISGDGLIDLTDLSLLLAEFGSNCD